MIFCHLVISTYIFLNNYYYFENFSKFVTQTIIIDNRQMEKLTEKGQSGPHTIFKLTLSWYASRNTVPPEPHTLFKHILFRQLYLFLAANNMTMYDHSDRTLSYHIMYASLHQLREALRREMQRSIRTIYSFDDPF